MTYIAYLDEFGHIGPYIARDDPRHNDSPVFGLAGFIMPLEVVRGFGTWFYQRKCDLLDFEIQRSGEHPAVWEKKGSSLYTVRNVTQYPELRQTTFRLLNKIQNLGGPVFYFGIRKTADPGNHEANAMYLSILAEAIRRLDLFCREDHASAERFLLALDEHPLRAELLTEAARGMYGGAEPRRSIGTTSSSKIPARGSGRRRPRFFLRTDGRLGSFSIRYAVVVPKPALAAAVRGLLLCRRCM